METPPTYGMAPKKSKTGLIIGIVVGVVAVCCVVPVVGMLVFFKNAMPGAFGMVACGWSAEDSRDGLLQYAKEHGGKLPAADKWQDSIQGYVKAISATRKKGDAKQVKLSDGSGDFCDYTAKTSLAYNTDVAGKKLVDLQNKGLVVLFETPGLGRNKAEKFKELDAKTAPKLMANIPRGWIEQPLEGLAYARNAQGGRQSIPRDGKNAGASVSINTEQSKD